MIVTLAGHVDHGKTSLVQCLTGKNTDRLAEEQRRGLTIDLGFAYLPLEGGVIGFVDVPGHHRFIHNMVAGVAAGQYALLVIAADDGPMPQSREHLQILELIGVRAGVIALSKCDRAGPDRVAAAEREIRALVAGSFLEGAEIVRTSATTGAGIPELAAHLARAHAGFAATASPRNFRLAVDRAFNVRGAGTVVTGTVHAGFLAADQELHVFPAQRTARAREIHVQNQPAARAGPGDRCAVNLSGINLEEVARGSWLTGRETGGHRALVVDLEVLENFPRAVRHWTPVHVYHATSHSTGRLALLGDAHLEPGARALVEVALDEPLLAVHGDRLVVRDFGLDLTLGGGAVLANGSFEGRRRDPARLRRLEAYRQDSPAACLDELLALGPVDVAAFAECWDLPEAQLAGLLEGDDRLMRNGHLIRIDRWRAWLDAAFREVAARHEADGTLRGLHPGELEAPVPQPFREPVLKQLADDGKLRVHSGAFAPAAHRVSLSAAEAALLDRVRGPLDQRQPPSLGDLAKQLRTPLPRLQKDLQPLIGKRLLVRVSDTRCYLPAQLLPLADIARALADAGPFTVRQFRDAAAIGRNVAIEVLEYFDARGFTRRTGDTRVVVGDVERLEAVAEG